MYRLAFASFALAGCSHSENTPDQNPQLPGAVKLALAACKSAGAEWQNICLVEQANKTNPANAEICGYVAQRAKGCSSSAGAPICVVTGIDNGRCKSIAY
jgi:hypothetical protein